jgi:hypothetical protein
MSLRWARGDGSVSEVRARVVAFDELMEGRA